MEFWQILKTFISKHTELINFASLSFGFTGIILAFLFYRASKPTRQLSYSTRTFRIISEKTKNIPGLEVKFDGQNVNAISVTRLAIWNGGSEPLRSTDIPENELLTIQAREGVEILKAELIESTSSAIRASMRKTNDALSRYGFHFEFLNPRDGAIANIIHNGTGLEDLSLLGTIIGGKIKRTNAEPETVTTLADPHSATTIMEVQSRRSYWEAMAFLSIGISIICSFISLFIREASFLIFIALLLLLVAFLILFSSRRNYPPSQLRMWDDNL